MDCLKCKSALRSIMARPRPKALLEALEKTGIKTLENAPESKRAGEEQPGTLNIKCLDCSEEGIAMKARAYMEAPPMSVVLCANRLQDRTEMEEALVHELVHVFDHALVKMDLTDCDQLAYSEVRAAREAECHYSPQLCSWFKRQCARSTATRSTSTLFPEEGAACVTRVFEKAYHDVAPAALHGPSPAPTPGDVPVPVPPPQAPPPPGGSGSKITGPPIGRIPAAASSVRMAPSSSLSSSSSSSGALLRRASASSSALASRGGAPPPLLPPPPPATGLAELLVEGLGMQLGTARASDGKG